MMVRKPLLWALLAAVVLVAGSMFWSWFTAGRGALRRARSADPAQRILAIDELEALPSGAARAALLHLAQDPELPVAQAALRTLAARGDPACLPALAELARNAPHPLLRAEAAASLGACKAGHGAQELDLLVDLLRHAQEPEVRAGAALGLARLRDRRALLDALAALSDPDPSVRAWALEAIQALVVRRLDFDPQRPPAAQVRQRQAIEQHLRELQLLP